MNENRNVAKTLSALTLLVVGTSAGAVVANTGTPTDALSPSLTAATSMNNLNDLAMAGFEASAKSSNLLANADGHHDDSIGSHHHHAIEVAGSTNFGGDPSAFDV